MFKEPFSFEGRIRRTEYALGLLIRALVYLTALYLASIVLPSMGIGGALFLFLVLFIPAFWFSLAQNTKRCHDRNNSGWFQIIPFYPLWMLFGPGDSGENDYGDDPKGSVEYY